MTRFVVHGIPGSPFVRCALLALEEKGADWRLSPLTAISLKQQPHLSRHPFGRMPVLEDGDFILYESQAILRYLDRVLPKPALTPADPRTAARMDQAMNINDWYLFQGVGNVIGFQRIVGPRLLGLAPDETLIEAAMPKAHTVFAELGRLLGQKSYFAGDELSLADLILAPQIDFFSQTPEWSLLTKAHPNLVAWLARMNNRASMKATTWERVDELARAA